MPFIKPSTARSSLRCIRSPAPFSQPALAQRHFSATRQFRSDDSHGSHYDPPSGWLWGIPPGQEYKKEGWENLFIYGFGGCLVFAVVGYAFKPDTSIQTWALEEARRRLEAEGILEDPEAKK
ncbi:hypothetical protein FKW77_000445 [Venturia effusa]|uniref:NADH dehydrogenase [ubiquinone] 1 beta subcomplex subunit 11, mitochondrial n=1 Tax=Venturia effusa TaxID=50376 RepID=A0A517LA94_9PEZI|nr:hypothetical protein FKW77_000445 [Venturia effusa]